MLGPPLHQKSPKQNQLELFLTSMDMESYRTAVSIRHAEKSSSLASVSSTLGSFYEEFVFIPGILHEGVTGSAPSHPAAPITRQQHGIGYPAESYTDLAERFVYADYDDRTDYLYPDCFHAVCISCSDLGLRKHLVNSNQGLEVDQEPKEFKQQAPKQREQVK